jgi:hypothetical protein
MSSKKAALFEKETNKWDQMGTVGDQMVPHLPARNPVKGQVILCWDVHLLNCGTILMQTRPKLFGLNLCHTGNQNSNQTMLSFSAVRNILGFASSAGSMVVVVVVGGLNAHQNDPSDPHLFGPVESCRAAPYSFKIEHLGAGARYVCIPSYFP